MLKINREKCIRCGKCTDICLNGVNEIIGKEMNAKKVFDDNYFSLLPNEKRTVAFRPSFEAESNTIDVSGFYG